MQQSSERKTGSQDRTGQPGVESALGRDRTQDGDLPPDMGTNTRSGPTGQTDTSGVSSVIDEAPVKVRQVADQARDTLGQVVDSAQEQVSQRVSEQIERVAEGLETVSHAMSNVVQELREQDQAAVATVAERVVEQVDHTARYLRGRNFDQIVADTERMAARRPALFLGGAFAVGLLAARFLKAAAPAQSRPRFGYDYRPALPPAGTTGWRGYQQGPTMQRGNAQSQPMSTPR